MKEWEKPTDKQRQALVAWGVQEASANDPTLTKEEASCWIHELVEESRAPHGARADLWEVSPSLPSPDPPPIAKESPSAASPALPASMAAKLPHLSPMPTITGVVLHVDLRYEGVDGTMRHVELRYPPEAEGETIMRQEVARLHGDAPAPPPPPSSEVVGYRSEIDRIRKRIEPEELDTMDRMVAFWCYKNKFRDLFAVPDEAAPALLGLVLELRRYTEETTGGVNVDPQ